VEEPWYRRAFGSNYVSVYAHRDEEEAERAVRLLERLTPLAGARVLDVACGAGRHMQALRACRARAIGLDLSDVLARRAAAVAPVALGDMRLLPFADRAFDGLVNMFTSFGYFERREENERVLREAARVLREGGWLLFDYLNAEVAVARLVPEGERVIEGARIRERRSYDPTTRVLTKEIRCVDTRSGRTEEWTERLVLFRRAEIESMLGGAGFDVRAHFGDYDGGPALPESPRLILFCAVPGGRTPRE
jgi:SAM-dependent methyltransferase